MGNNLFHAHSGELSYTGQGAGQGAGVGQSSLGIMWFTAYTFTNPTETTRSPPEKRKVLQLSV